MNVCLLLTAYCLPLIAFFLPLLPNEADAT